MIDFHLVWTLKTNTKSKGGGGTVTMFFIPGRTVELKLETQHVQLLFSNMGKTRGLYFLLHKTVS